MRDLTLRFAAWSARHLPRSLVDVLYRVGPASRGLRLLLNRAAPHGFQDVVVASGLLQGAQFVLDLQREKDLWLGTYEPSLQRALERSLRPGMTFFDVGANIGYITVGAARLVAATGEVHAFEPLPDNVAKLRDASERNGLHDRIRVVEAAVASRSGRGTLMVHASHAMGKLEGSLGRGEEYSGSLDVTVLSLDDYVHQQGHTVPDWVKIDVEGGEASVLEGMERMLQEIGPGLLMELHGPDAAAVVFRVLSQADYVIYPLVKPQKILADPSELPWKAYVGAERRKGMGR